MINLNLEDYNVSGPYVPQERGFAHSLGTRVNAFATSLYNPLFFSVDFLVYHYHYLVDGETPLLARIFTVFAKLFSMCVVACGIPAGIVFFLLGKGLHQIGDALTGQSFTTLEGDFHEDAPDQYSSLTVNVCMLPYGLTIRAGMRKSAYERAARISEAILEKNPKFVCLQEVAAPMGYSFYEQLKGQYHSFILDVGQHRFIDFESGLFFASKEPILRHFWIPFNNDFGIDRGLLIVETEHDWLISTHLTAGQHDATYERRQAQFHLIDRVARHLNQATPVKRIHLLGDLNEPDIGSQIFQNFYDPYRADRHEVTAETATCTGLLAARLGIEDMEWESIDYAVTYKPSMGDSFQCRSELVRMFDMGVPDDANSDHNGIYTEQFFNEPRRAVASTGD